MSAPIDAHEIREALEAHAQFTDTAAVARLGSVRARVRVVRRRRRAALAGAAAAVVAVVGGVTTLLPGSDEAAPASRSFEGLTAPATLTSEGATYSFEKLVTGTREARWTDDLDGPSLVTWASPLDGPVIVTKTFDGEDLDPSFEDFRDFIALEGKDEQTIQAVTSRGRVALAVYTLESPAPGARADIDGTPVVLREDIPGFRGIDAVWGEPGQTEVTLTLRHPERTLELASFCTGPRGYDLHVDVEGPGSWGACDDEPSVRGPGSRIGFSDGIERADGSFVQPGDQITVRLWLSRKGSDARVDGPLQGVRMGVALYEQEPTVATIGDWPLTELREEAGHTWRFVRVLEGSPEPRRRFEASVDVGSRPALVVFTAGAGAGLVRPFVDGEEGGGYSSDTGEGTFLGTAGPVGAGVHTLSLRSTHPTRFGVALYERAD